MKLSYSSALLLNIILCMFLCMPLSGCKHEKTLRIGVSQCSSDDWRKKMNEEIMREAILHDNIYVKILSADDNNEKQISDLEYFADNGYDIIIAAPNEAQALTPTIDKIYASGMPILLFDRQINSDNYTAYQGADNAEIGRLAAKMALTLGGKNSKIIEIRGLAGSSPEIERNRGFNEEAQKIGLQVLGAEYGDWNQIKGKEAAITLLDKYPDATLIYAHNDRMAIAASEVAKSRGRDDIKVIGIDAAPTIGIQAVKDGVIDATFLYPTAGSQLIRTALAILEGKPYEHYLTLPSPAAVDSSNADLLLVQDNALRDETSKIETLKSQLDLYWQQHSMQTALLYGTIIILALLMLVIFLLIRTFWVRKRHQEQIELRNQELAKQKDELSNLYTKLQEATTSKLTFFTNVSHDLRTPLTLIANPVEQMVDAENLTAQQNMLMKLADKNVKRLMRLINQILDLRKYDNSHLSLHLANVDLAAAVREWASSFTNVATKRHIGFNTEIQADEKFVTAIDIEKIERVLFNLISNSFKFTPANGQITIGLEKKGNNILLTVTDSGIGIAPDEIHSVFDRFFTNDQINPNGSGIGLALSKIFVEMHGGTISVESQVGKGTTFTVELPVRQIDEPLADISASVTKAVADADELALVEDESIPVTDDAPTVLVIDDNSDIRMLIKSLLCDQYTVIQASSGAQGIRLASKYIPDLIICDVMMPGIDGYVTCREIKSEVVTSHIPVLMLTACSQDEQRTESYTSGADAYMSKPFDGKMLKARCESLIQNRKRIMSAASAAPIAAPAKSSNAQAKPDADIDNEFYHRFVAIIDKELSNSELTVEEIADQLGLSRVQMYRKIKAITNYSPAELMRNIRLERAAVLLKTTESTISEVAYGVGFSAPNHFTKCYKQYFGELPSDTQQRTSKKS